VRADVAEALLMRLVLSRLFGVRAWLLAAVCATLLAGCGDEQPSLSALPPDAVILAFGDSLTYGTGAKPGEGYPEVLAASIARTVVNAGVPGETSAGGLRRLPGALAASKPSLVVLCSGGNDILRRLPLTQAAENLRTMIRMIRESGAQVVLLGVPKFGLILDSVPFYAQVAEEEQVPIDTDILADILSDNDLKSDTVHPNAAGYAKLAAAVANLLREGGAL
jgi:acyl-CoA thioesterase-1